MSPEEYLELLTVIFAVFHQETVVLSLDDMADFFFFFLFFFQCFCRETARVTATSSFFEIFLFEVFTQEKLEKIRLTRLERQPEAFDMSCQFDHTHTRFFLALHSREEGKKKFIEGKGVVHEIERKMKCVCTGERRKKTTMKKTD